MPPAFARRSSPKSASDAPLPVESSERAVPFDPTPADKPLVPLATPAKPKKQIPLRLPPDKPALPSAVQLSRSALPVDQRSTPARALNPATQIHSDIPAQPCATARITLSVSYR